VWRYHPVLTDSPFGLQAEAQHRDHAVVEQAQAPIMLNLY
jgi:predicted RNA methylase